MKLFLYETEKEMLNVVKYNGSLIQYIYNPSEEVQLAAVKESADSLQYIHNPTEKTQLEAAKRNGHALQYIHNPSEKVQLAAVKEDGCSIKYINNPSEKVIRYLLDNYSSDKEVIQLLFARIGEEGYNRLSDEDKLLLELSN